MLPIVELDHHPVFRDPKHHHTPKPITPDIGKEVLETYGDRIQQQRNWDIPDDPVVLGRGTRGTVYDLGNNVAMKLTSDTSEAEASEKVRKTPIDGVVEIFDVFALGSTGYFCIVQEKLQRMTHMMSTEIQKLLKEFDLGDYLQGNGYDPKAVERAVDEDVRELHDHGQMPKAKELYDTFSRIEELGLLKIAANLHKAGIQFHDYHEGNLMMRGHELVVVDLGKSKVVGGAPPPVVERNYFWRANAEMAWRSRLFKMIG